MNHVRSCSYYIVSIIIFTFTLGLLQEIFETWTGVSLLEYDFTVDMVLNLSMYMIGVVVLYMIDTNLNKL